MTRPFYRLWLTNFNYYLDAQFARQEDAVAYAKTKGFETAIHLTHGGGTQVVGYWGPLGGFRPFRNRW